MNEEEPESLEDSLRAHAVEAAARCRAKMGGPLSTETLALYLHDRACSRYPLVLVFDDTDLEEHQFAQPFFFGDEHERTCTLRIHPRFQDRPEEVPYLVAYIAAAISYGELASARLCEQYGAALVGMEEQEFYELICKIVDR